MTEHAPDAPDQLERLLREDPAALKSLLNALQIDRLSNSALVAEAYRLFANADRDQSIVLMEMYRRLDRDWLEKIKDNG